MRGALYDRRVFAADNALSTYFSRSQIQTAYVSLAHEKRWCEVSHIVGMVLSSNYSQFITDAAHAALIASMLVFFYFDRAHTKKKRRAVNLTMKERGGL